MAPPNGPKKNPQEQVRKGWVDIGKSLRKLKKTLSTRGKIEKKKNETPEEERARTVRREQLQAVITDHLKGLGGSMEALKAKTSTLNLPAEALDRYTEIELALFGPILLDGTVTANELLGALTDRKVQIDPATAAADLEVGDLDAANGTLIISAKDLDDEIEGLDELRTAGEAFEAKMEGLYNMLPESVRGFIDSSTFVTMIQEFIAKWLEGAGIATGFAATLRISMAKRKANNRGYELRDDYMAEVEAEFGTRYEEWLANKAEKQDSKIPPPDMFGMIVKKYREVGASDEEQAQLDLNKTNVGDFLTAAKDGPMFVVPTAEVKVEGNEYKAERPAGGQWTITMPMEGFKVSIDPTTKVKTFELQKSSPDLKKALEAANGVAAIESVKLGDAVKLSGKEFIYSIDSQLGAEGLEKLITLMPAVGDKWQSVESAPDGETIIREAGVLKVPKNLLGNNLLPKLRVFVNAADPNKSPLRIGINGAGNDWAEAPAPAPQPQPQPQPQNPPAQNPPPQNP
jgi:hypothetical protein